MSNSILTECDVLILSGNYGTGHLQVSEALKSTILETCPDWNIEIFDFFSLIDPIFSQVVEFSYHNIIKYFSPGYRLFYKATCQISPDSNWQKHLNSIGQKEIEKFIFKKKPRIIVCTFPTPAGVLSELKGMGRISVPIVTVITDVAVHSQWIHPYIDYYFVPADTVSTDMEYMGVPKEKIIITGIPLRKQFEAKYDKDIVLEKYGLHSSLPTILVSGGGKGILSGIIDICRRLGNLKIPVQVLVVTGQNKSLARRLHLALRFSERLIKVLGYVDNMAELLDACDIMITKAGGVTVFEALCKGIPMIIFKPIPGHEESNVKFLMQNNAARTAKNWRQIKNSLDELIFVPSSRDKIINNMEVLSKPSSSQLAATIIIKTALSQPITKIVDEQSATKAANWRYA